MKLRSVARVVVVCLAALGLVGAGAHAVFTTSTTSGQTITAGNWGTTPPPTTPTTPTVTITYPVNNTTYGSDWGGAITGTVSDALGSVTFVGVSLQQGSGSTSCWTGSDATFSATCPNYVAVTTGTTSWSLTLSTTDLTSGDSYNVVAQAKDSVGNVFTSATVAFTYNTAAPALPTVAISYPVNGTTYGTDWGGAITGTAAANAAGASISDVEVSIQESGGSCWTGSGDTYTASCPNYLPVTSGTTSWSLTLSTSDLSSGDSYAVTAQATDSDANLGTSSTVTFSYDTTAPTVAITFPVNGTHYDATTWTGTITGTASSNSGGSTTITSVSVAIEDTTTTMWWNGTSFSATTQTFLPVTSGTTTWLLTFAAANLNSGDSYSVVAQATDSAGNVGTSSTVSFTYCNRTSKAPPTVTITYPVNGTTYGVNWTGTITGTASSNSGPGTTITATEVAIEDTTTGKWWSGTSFSAGTKTFVAVSGNATWYLGFAASNLNSGDSYAVMAEATDSVGNVGTSPTVSFTYDVTPTVIITYPCNSKTYGADWTGEITGTASAGPGATIASVSVAVEDTKTGTWWNGTSFSATAQTFVAVTSGTTTWFLTFAASDLTSGDSYTVIAEATDNDGDIGTSSTVSFTYCLGSKEAPPTVIITYPVNDTSYGADWTGTITGTASSNSGDQTTITSVSVAVEDTATNKWWNGTSFGAGAKTFVAASGKTTWYLLLGASSLTWGVTYTVMAEATDSLGNLGTSSLVTFTYGTVLPKVLITYPVSGPPYGADWEGAITGTASDAVDGIVGVKVSVQQNNGGSSCWTGAGNTFTASCPNYVPVTTGITNWSLTFAAGNLTSGDAYTVLAQAKDFHGNIGTSTPVSFTYNTTAPTVSITYPVNATTYGADWGGAVTGTAGGPTVLSNVKVSVQQGSGGNVCWTGSGSSFTAACPNYLPVTTGTTNWSLSLGASSLTSGDSYTAVAQATDSGGNVGTSATVGFTYSTATTPPTPPSPPAPTPPTVTITYPVNNTTYGFDWTGKITGTASSNSEAGTTITATSVAVENIKTDRWWSGTAFNLGAQTFLAATGTTAWSLPLGAQNLNWGVTYKVVAQAKDSLGNVGTSSTVSFTYTWVNPKVFKVYPRYMGDCGGQCSTGIYWTITGTNFVPGATVSFPSTGPSADFSVVKGSVKVIDSTTIVLLVKDTGATKGKATVVVTDPGETPALGSITATGKPDPTSLSIVGPSTVAQGTHTTLRLKVSGMSCATWGGLAVYFSNPGITGGRATCSGGIVSVPITVSPSALLGNSSVTVLVENKDFALSTNGLKVEVTAHG